MGGRIKVENLVLDTFGNYLGMEKGCIILRDREEREAVRYTNTISDSDTSIEGGSIALQKKYNAFTPICKVEEVAFGE